MARRRPRSTMMSARHRRNARLLVARIAQVAFEAGARIPSQKGLMRELRAARADLRARETPPPASSARDPSAAADDATPPAPAPPRTRAGRQPGEGAGPPSRAPLGDPAISAQFVGTSILPQYAAGRPRRPVAGHRDMIETARRAGAPRASPSPQFPPIRLPDSPRIPPRRRVRWRARPPRSAWGCCTLAESREHWRNPRAADAVRQSEGQVAAMRVTTFVLPLAAQALVAPRPHMKRLSSQAPGGGAPAASQPVAVPSRVADDAVDAKLQWRTIDAPKPPRAQALEDYCPPLPEAFEAQAALTADGAAEAYKASLDDPSGFWASEADRYHWQTPFDR